nr:Chain C, Angiotensin II [Homo sapiens]3WOO_D Chain D, Angiotensin II [Homo sapiens]3WOP_C Chain C, Angiotensin IV [Homo sapiens]3WOP_D Chain D, Angiotensin IV [Homo sapiens]3WOQ_C Chain C, Angiotensin IV [Homo sapiens]3WOQ_D Chain D, Angiotensin IV [Homo sapiens]4FYS_C Chain C, Angiotensin IV [Homo sapiens]
VYIHPF